MTEPQQVAAAAGSDMVLRAGLATDVGRVRSRNEDRALVSGTVFVVADGMGGHAAGDVASGIVVEVLSDLVGHPTRKEDIVRALTASNETILRSVAEHPEQQGMGTTATGVMVVSAGGSDHWAVFNVGDSRVYRFLDGSLSQVTVDHSEVREMVDAGLITESEAARHPLRNVVTRSLGTDPCPTPDIWVFPPYPGERFVICSDGLSGELGADAIREIIAGVDDPQQAADLLVRRAVEAGGRDNVTAIVVALDAGTDEEDFDADTAPRSGAGESRG